jgi:hypothetical protein
MEPNPMHREFWWHEPSERLWAVQIVDGVVVGAAGPFHPADVLPNLLNHVLYFRCTADWISKHRGEFRHTMRA